MFFEIDQMNEDFMSSLIAIGIFLLFLLFRKLFTKYIYKMILHLTKKTPTDFFTHVWISFENPIRMLFIIIGFYISAVYFPFFNEKNEMFQNIISSSIIILITWGMYNLSSTSSLIFTKLHRRLNIEFDQIVIPFLSKALRFIVIAIGFSIVIQEFGYNINSIIAGLGLGGLAVALAAQDALSNLFGGIVIITEKPFSIGDWIKTPSVEGTVEDISFRSTTVRTFAQAAVVVPNATLVKEPITNWSKMGKRQITFQLQIAYGTPAEKLHVVVQKINEHLRNHQDVHQETIFATFDQFDTYSYNIFLYFFTKTTNWGEYLQVKQAINFEILNILEESGVELAYPSRKLYVRSEDESGLVDREH